VAVMNAGKVEQAGTPWEIYYHPKNAFLADFVGAVNLVPSTVREVRDGTAVVSVGSTNAPVRVPDGLVLASGAQVQLCIRPESLQLRSPRAAGHGELVVASA